MVSSSSTESGSSSNWMTGPCSTDQASSHAASPASQRSVFLITNSLPSDFAGQGSHVRPHSRTPGSIQHFLSHVGHARLPLAATGANRSSNITFCSRTYELEFNRVFQTYTRGPSSEIGIPTWRQRLGFPCASQGGIPVRCPNSQSHRADISPSEIDRVLPMSVKPGEITNSSRCHRDFPVSAAGCSRRHSLRRSYYSARRSDAEMSWRYHRKRGISTHSPRCCL